MKNTSDGCGSLQWRHDGRGWIKALAIADGYVMCRRPRAMPFILRRKEWDAMTTGVPSALNPHPPTERKHDE